MTNSDAQRPFHVWWVNQGHTYAKAKEDGFLWAPIPGKGGQGFPHWDSMTEVRPGDLVINYGFKRIVAFSVARSRAVKHQNRKKEGWRVDMDYHDLPEPIDLEEIKPIMGEIAASIKTNQPFDAFHNIMQGYLFNFSHLGLDRFIDAFGDRFPEKVRSYLGLDNTLTFDAFAYDKGFTFDADLVKRYVLSLKSSPFVILSGKSGTGKTGLARLYAQYLDETERLNRKPSGEGSGLMGRRWFKLSFNDKTIVNAFEGHGKKINLVRKTILKDGIMSLVGLDSKKHIDMNQKKMMKDLQTGDVIIAYQGGYTVGGIGVVTEPHFYDDSGDAYDSFFESTKNFIRLDWIYKGPLKINDFYMDDSKTPAFSMWGDTIHSMSDEQVNHFIAYLAGKDIHMEGEGIRQMARPYELVSVSTRWADSSPLLGSYDPVSDEYRSTKTLELILNAKEALQKGSEIPFVLVIDGMNAVNPFAFLGEILCAMETGEAIPLHNSDDVAQYTRIPRDLTLPSNLCIVATVYEDGVSLDSSILDRCNVIELPLPDGSSYVKNYSSPGYFSAEPPIHPRFTPDSLTHTQVIERMEHVRIPLDGQPGFQQVMTDVVERLQTLLAEMNSGLGFRVVKDIMAYLYMSWDQDRRPQSWDGWADALDAQILQRIVPKIRAKQKNAAEPLESFYRFCFEDGSGDPLEPESARFKRTAKQLKEILDVLERTDFPSIL